MQCPQCQRKNPPGARFCHGCGARAEPAWSQCGQGNPSGSRFCNRCGADVVPAGPQPCFASPETYTPKHGAEKILVSKAALEGDRKQVTVLFADLRVSMEMRPLVAHCHLGLGKLYRRTGERDQAQEHLATATTMYREMDMRFWLDKAEVEMKECTENAQRNQFAR